MFWDHPQIYVSERPLPLPCGRKPGLFKRGGEVWKLVSVTWPGLPVSFHWPMPQLSLHCLRRLCPPALSIPEPSLSSSRVSVTEITRFIHWWQDIPLPPYNEASCKQGPPLVSCSWYCWLTAQCLTHNRCSADIC